MYVDTSFLQYEDNIDSFSKIFSSVTVEVSEET